MIPILKTLDQISTNYTVFEKNQVLSASQLNSLSEYFEDQTRLSRTLLTGVGIVCGLKASAVRSLIRVTRGTGITTDGDLIYLPQDCTYQSYKVYDESNPVYPPFFTEKKMIPVFELSSEKAGKRLTSLTQFSENTGYAFSDMVVVVYMESYIYDPDICSDTDCDNKGRELRNNLKALLIPKAFILNLQTSITTPATAFGGLDEIVIGRPVFTPAITSTNQLADLYRSVCSELDKRIEVSLESVIKNCSFFLKDIFPANPLKTWIERLSEVRSLYQKTDIGIQYYYDFLKDLAETHNQFFHLIFGDNTMCCPSHELFPKHLLLGNLNPVKNSTENRTGFYPSTVLSQSKGDIEHARFLMQKIDAMISNFKVQVQKTPDIRITPSQSEESVSEERAIPYFYQLSQSTPIYNYWNYRLTARKMGAYNYSYNATEYQARGAAANPLGSGIGKFPFFRIEGHVGVDIIKAHAIIEKKIVEMNLPFTLRSVHLGTERGRVVIKPGIRYGDLHRFHYLLRQDIFRQMDDVKEFSRQFRVKVDDAIRNKVVIDTSDGNDGASIGDLVEEKDRTIGIQAAAVQRSMSLNFTEYSKNTEWKNGLTIATKTSGELKSQLGKIVKTEFPSPADSLIANPHNKWLEWIEDILRRREEKEDEKLLFPNFVKLHPGVEHYAGVPKGGTFILVYDNTNQVVADFMLPFYCPETAQEQDNEPELKLPTLRDPWLIAGGIRVITPIDRLVNSKIDFVKDDLIRNKIDLIEKDINSRFDRQQSEYFASIKESLGTVSNALTSRMSANAAGILNPEITDSGLIERVSNVTERQNAVSYMRRKAAEAGTDTAAKTKYEELAKEAEKELAVSVKDAASYVSDNKMDVSPGTEGYKAMMDVNSGVLAVNEPEVKADITSHFETIKAGTASPSLNLFLGRMIVK